MIVPDDGAFVKKTIRSEYQEYLRTLSFKTCIWVFFLFLILLVECSAYPYFFIELLVYSRVNTFDEP
jgi:uncharacterized membrane protein required for colicin V production